MLPQGLVNFEAAICRSKIVIDWSKNVVRKVDQLVLISGFAQKYMEIPPRFSTRIDRGWRCSWALLDKAN